jgi:hypothetical protein
MDADGPPGGGPSGQSSSRVVRGAGSGSGCGATGVPPSALRAPTSPSLRVPAVSRSAVSGASVARRSAGAVVALVAVALVGLSARAPQLAVCDTAPRGRPLPPRVGTAVAAACLSGAGAIVLVGLWAMIMR